MQDEHLDLALAEEFAGHAATIHKLKVSDPHFKDLMKRNHEIWATIQSMKHDVKPVADETRHDLEKERLKLLDEIASKIKAAEA